MPRASVPKRRTQEERRNDTRKRVLNAALKLLREHGHAAFTTTRVAALAGVSRGAQENHFRTRAELIAAAGKYAMDQSAEHARAMAARAATARDPLESFLEDSRHFFFSPAFFAMVELALGARSEPKLKKIHADLYRYVRSTLDKIWSEALYKAGYTTDSIDRVIQFTNYLLRGAVLARLILPVRPDIDALMTEWEKVARNTLKLRRSRKR
ncbi:MAG TPA: TetR/AcrR family transcriptional regulator [Xanthobacteraceae bacterium]|nr:TetR/AcrR family transcriptional regulator [Xanthobacteraceae bacterium]